MELLYAEAQLGEILAGIDKSESRRSSRKGTSLKSLPPNTTKKDSHYAQQLRCNTDIIEETINDTKKEQIA